MALKRLILHDFVLVETLEIEWLDGFGVLTGETGAGKSILIDALQLCMGARADTHFIREGCNKADISAIFDAPKDAATLAVLDEFGIPNPLEDELILRRSLDAQGKSRAWINGIPATATQLRTLGAWLVDIHGQHAWQSLLQADSMRKTLDDYGQIDTRTIAQLWQQYRHAQKALEAAQHNQAQQQDSSERLQWQLSEMQQLQPQANEWESLNQEHQRLAHAHELLSASKDALQQLEGEQFGALRSLHTASQALQAHSTVAPEFQTYAETLETALIQVQEVARNLHTSLGNIDLDPNRLQQLDERLSQWLSLARRFKHEPQQLPALQQQWQDELEALQHSQDIAQLQQQLTEAQHAYQQAAEQITTQRQQAAQTLSQAISQAMQTLGMEGGAFAAQVSTGAQPNAYGQDQVEFMVAGHTGSSLRPVAKVASGGELSRIALAISVCTSQTGASPTLIFDEVDAGIGGNVAHTVGTLMRQLGSSRQVLAVTHLAQVAACANFHLHVRKTTPDQKHASSHVTLLNEIERTAEIARMLGGSAQSSTSMAHAKEMLAVANPTP